MGGHMASCEHPTHHIDLHTYLWRTGMGKIVGDRARTGQPCSASCLILLHHTKIGTVQNVDFLHSALEMATFNTHVENKTVLRILVFPWKSFKYSFDVLH